MRRSFMLGLVPAIPLAVASGALAQAKTLQQQLVGTWKYVSIEDTHNDGTHVQSFGADPSGIVIFEANGYYAAVVARPDLPKFASNSRLTGTADENKTAMQGSLGHFGTYTANDSDHSFTTHVLGSTYPNIIGADRKFIILSITDDALTWSPVQATGGGRGRGVLRRVK